MKVERGAILWAIPCHLFFGICNFLISLTNKDPVDSWAVTGVLWTATGSIGIPMFIYHYRRKGALFYVEDEDQVKDKNPTGTTSCKVMAITIIGGFCVGFSQLMMKLAFGLAPSSVGPLTAVISSDVIVVSIFCHFVYRELLNRKQAIAVMFIVAGLATMGLGGSGEADNTSVDVIAAEHMVPAFGFGLCGMASFAAAILSIRVGCGEYLSPWSGFTVRMLVNAVMGVLAFVYSLCTAGMPSFVGYWWIWAILAGLSQAPGVLCLNNALTYGNTGVTNAIAASNSVTVLILNMVICQLFPSILSLVGMFFVVFAVTGMSLLDGGGEEDAVDKPTPRPSLTAIHMSPGGFHLPQSGSPGKKPANLEGGLGTSLQAK